MITVFSYTDFRKFLADFIVYKKASNPRFSNRMLATRAGFTPGHLTRILQGRTRISLDLALKLAEFCKMTKRQTEYFQHLIRYNQADNHEEKRKFFEKMLSYRESSIRVVEADQYEYYDKWYYSAIRSVLGYYRFNGNFAELGSMIVPAISAEEAQKAIQLLTRLSMIRKEPSGEWSVSEPLIRNTEESSTLAINNFVIASLDLARRAIDRFPRNERTLSSTTIAISYESYDKIKDDVRDLRRRIMELAANDPAPQRSYMLNFQLFPIAQPTPIRRRS